MKKMTTAAVAKLERDLWSVLHKMLNAFKVQDSRRYGGKFADTTLREVDQFEEYVYAFDEYLDLVYDNLDPFVSKHRRNKIAKRWDKVQEFRLQYQPFIYRNFPALAEAMIQFEDQYN